jgi:hypothetical protein
VLFGETSSISVEVNSVEVSDETAWIEFIFESPGPVKKVEIGYSFFYDVTYDELDSVEEGSKEVQDADNKDSDVEKSEKAEGDGDKDSNHDQIIVTKDQIITNLGKLSLFDFIECDEMIEMNRITVQIVLKIPIETNSYIQGMSKLHTTGNNFSDIKIICGGETFKCNKAILAARSDVFSAMFNMPDSSEYSTGVVKIDDIEDAKTMRALLQFIYEGRVAQKELSPELKIAANKYNLPTLTSCCNNLPVEDLAPFKFETKYNEDNYSAIKRTTIRGILNEESYESEKEPEPKTARTTLPLDKKTDIEVAVYNIEHKRMPDCLIMQFKSKSPDTNVEKNVEFALAFSSSHWNFSEKNILAPLGTIRPMKRISYSHLTFG